MKTKFSFDALVEALAEIELRGRESAARSVDQALTARNWLVGMHILVYEQRGADRAAHGARVIDRLAGSFADRGIRGLSARSLRNCRAIAATWPRLLSWQTASANSALIDADLIWQTVSAKTDTSELSWQNDDWFLQMRTALSCSHLLELTRVHDAVERAFYELHAVREQWSVRELKRQRSSMLYQRTGLSEDKRLVLQNAAKGASAFEPEHLIRDPYVLEFLGLPTRGSWSESDLEKALVSHLEQFLLELGRDFCFMGRQVRITVGGRHHFIDLLFFHRKLRCLFVVDLKLGPFRHEYAGQMNLGADPLLRRRSIVTPQFSAAWG